MRLYLAGPMAGIVDFNFPAFNDAATVLRAQGHEVENPAEFGEELSNPSVPMSPKLRASYLKVDFNRLTTCDALVVLPGWTSSIGVHCELAVAAMVDMQTYAFKDGALEAADLWPDLSVVRRHMYHTWTSHVRSRRDMERMRP